LESLGFSEGNLNLESLRIYTLRLSTEAEARKCGLNGAICAADRPHARKKAERSPLGIPRMFHIRGQGEGIGGDAARDAPPIFPPFGGRYSGLWPSMGPDGADGSLRAPLSTETSAICETCHSLLVEQIRMGAGTHKDH
jgi:hypothetical protein